MDYKSKQSRQMKAVAIATGASILAAVATMFVPVSVLESITGATGVSELVSATAAPLGDTARALIAFGTGALTMAAMTALLLRRDTVPTKLDVAAEPAVGIPEDDNDLVLTFRERIAQWGLPEFKLPKMPWVKGQDDITDLADLPKLRGGDIHPDAPPRRPLSATSDLPVLDLTKMQTEEIVEEKAGPAFGYELASEARKLAKPSLEEMVAQLEAAVAQRQRQLDELEAVAAKLAAEKPVEISQAPVPAEVPAEIEVEILAAQPVRAERPPLEAVPTSPDKADDMDEALAAALATLHRMNGTDR